MPIDSVMSAGLAGMQLSQRAVTAAAEEIASAARPAMRPADAGNAGSMAPPLATEQSAPNESRDLVEPLIEMRRQEQLFTASAKMVAIADKTLGSLIDVTS